MPECRCGPNGQQNAVQASSRAYQSDLLNEVEGIVYGPRRESYGHPLDNHNATAEFWSTFLWRRFGVRLALNYRDVCTMNDLQKTSRDAFCPKHDNLVDKVGFALNTDICVREEARRKAEGKES